MDDTNNNVFEWRKLDAPIPPEVWRTGHWTYGCRGEEPDPCDQVVWIGDYHDSEKITGGGEWWAPCNADGSPRPWPEVASSVAPQPAPQPGTVDVWPLVIEDMRRRDVDGRRRYGTPLQAHNGRDALVDAYHEALDQAVYLRQEIVQREDAAAEIAALQADNDRLRVKLECLTAELQQVKETGAVTTIHLESQVHTAHALVYLRVARAVPADREYWLRLARESRDHAREARKEERLPAF